MAEYLRRVVQARQGYARSYLMYGSMLRPPEINVPKFRISGAAAIPYSGDLYPAFDAPSILSSAWSAPDGSVGYIFTNIAHEPVGFRLQILPDDVGLTPGATVLLRRTLNGEAIAPTSRVRPPVEISVSLEPLDVMLFELVTGIFSDGFESGDTTMWSVSVP